MTDPDKDSKRLCLNCGTVCGPAHDIASDFAIFYLTVLKDGGYELTDEQLDFAANLVTRMDNPE
jgi:hypothetical protein